MGRKQRNTLILALVLAAVLGTFLIRRQLLSREGVTAIVQVGSQEEELDLSRDQEFWVGTPETGQNLIRVKDGAVMVAEADCPDRICVLTGPISQEGEIIACLPHGLIVYIQRREG